VNEGAGSSGDTPRRRIEDALTRATIAAQIEVVPGPGIAAAAVRAAAQGHTIVAGGGDGTVSTVGSVAAQAGAVFGVLPLGTLNHFARDAGVPLELDDAVNAIGRGRVEALDTAEVNGRRFLNNFSIGFYVRIVRERERQQQRGRGKWPAFALALARAWVRYRTITVRLEVDGKTLVRRTPFVFIGNGVYQAQGLEVGTRTSLQGGMLSIYIAPECGRLDLVALSARALAGRLTPDVTLEAFTAPQVTIETASPRVAAALDGELIALRPPLVCTVHRGSLKTLLPSP
jgi:diacylglycerol kinase family enzyme